MNEVKQQFDNQMKAFIQKGEKSAFTTRDLLIKLNSLSKTIYSSEDRNKQFLSQGFKEITVLTNKIYDNLRYYDLNQKLATIDENNYTIDNENNSEEMKKTTKMQKKEKKKSSNGTNENQNELKSIEQNISTLQFQQRTAEILHRQ